MNTEDERQMNFCVKYMKGKPDIFFDFGVGYINSASWFVHEKWPECTIIGLEACSGRYKNLLAHGYPGTLLHLAIAEKPGKVRGFEGGKYGMFINGLEKARREEWNNHKEVWVDGESANNLYLMYRKTPLDTIFIWSDTEGMDLQMLHGANSLFDMRRVVGLNVELYPKNPKRLWPYYTGSRCTADQVVGFLKEKKYRNMGSTHADPKPDTHTKENPDYESREWFGDFFFMPEELCAQ